MYGNQQIECESAEEFLQELDETNPRWAGSSWIFRGQNADCEVHPTAMRSRLIDNFVNDEFDNYSYLFIDDEEPYRAKWKAHGEEVFNRHVRVALHVIAEKEIVYTFADLADRVGLDTVSDKNTVFKYLKERITLNYSILVALHEKWIELDPSDILFALARHHGLPTRLLDWTYRPLFAAFFAAYCDRPPKPEPKRIIVWAVREAGLLATSLKVVSHRRGLIGFLRSQDGVFLYDEEANKKYYESGIWQPFDVEFEKLILLGNAFKLTLPYSEREQLLDLLSRKYISKPFLMPSFDNVAEEIVMRRVDWRSANYP